jgi:hypothetical protein
MLSVTYVVNVVNSGLREGRKGGWRRQRDELTVHFVQESDAWPQGVSCVPLPSPVCWTLLPGSWAQLTSFPKRHLQRKALGPYHYAIWSHLSRSCCVCVWSISAHLHRLP